MRKSLALALHFFFFKQKTAYEIFAASLVVAQATVQACLLRKPETLTLIASADHPEDHACALYMEGIIRGLQPDLETLLQPLRETERYRRARSGKWPGFPATDLDLSLAADRFEFAMPVTKENGYLRLAASTQRQAEGAALVAHRHTPEAAESQPQTAPPS